MIRICVAHTASKPEQHRLLDRIDPAQAHARAEEVAWACGFLASDKAKFITSQVISPNDGFLM
jgi:hypothetical protein